MPHREHINRLAGEINVAERKAIFANDKVDEVISKIFETNKQVYIVEGDVRIRQEFNQIINLINISLEGNRIEGDNIMLDGNVQILGDFYLSGNQILSGVIESDNWGVSAGGQLDLANGTLKFGGSSDPNFSIGSDGNIVSKGGTAAGFTINSTEGFYAGSGVTRVQMKPGAGIWTGATAIGDAPFSVTNAGVLKATGVDVSGKITVGAGSPTIGTGYTQAKCTDASANNTATIINGGLITTGSISLNDGSVTKAGITAAGVGDANIRIWAGHATPASAPFRVTQGGALIATSANITGIITANTGYIGGASGWTIASKTLTGANDSKIISGILQSSDWGTSAGSQLNLVNKTLIFGGSSSYKFKIDSSGNITAKGGKIGNWEIYNNNLLRSAASGARIELNQNKHRISIFDVTAEKVVMGYLNGLAKNDGSGNWGVNDYGFWAKAGDYLVIDGDVEYESGDWIIQSDGCLKILDGSDNEVLRLGKYGVEERGLRLWNATGTMLAKLLPAEILIGQTGANKANMIYDTTNGLRLRIDTTDKIKLDNSGNVTFSGTVNSPRFQYDANNYIDLQGATAKRIYLGAGVFEVDKDGKLTCTSATVTGAINATSGEIIGTLTMGALGKISLSGDSYLDKDKIFLGSLTTNSMELNNTGKLVCKYNSAEMFSLYRQGLPAATILKDNVGALYIVSDVIHLKKTGAGDVICADGSITAVNGALSGQWTFSKSPTWEGIGDHAIGLSGVYGRIEHTGAGIFDLVSRHATKGCIYLRALGAFGTGDQGQVKIYGRLHCTEDAYLDSGKKIYLNGVGGNTYFVWNNSLSRIDVYVAGSIAGYINLAQGFVSV